MIAAFKGSRSFGSNRAQMSFVNRFKVRRSHPLDKPAQHGTKMAGVDDFAALGARSGGVVERETVRAVRHTVNDAAARRSS
jgi:hypothetical protein